jgi:hypothetical protein
MSWSNSYSSSIPTTLPHPIGSNATKPAGWGLEQKSLRSRAAEERKKIIPENHNDPFVFKRPQQHHSHNHNHNTTNTTAPTPVITTPAPSIATAPPPSSSATPSVAVSSSPIIILEPDVSSSIKPSSSVLCSSLVDLFEIVEDSSQPKPFGAKGLAIQRSNNDPSLIQLVVYAPVKKSFYIEYITR